MFKRSRSSGFKVVTGAFALAIFGLLVMAIYDSGRKHGEAIGEYAANTDTYARHTQENVKDCLSLPEDGTKTKCIIEVVEACNEHERSEKDLIAQTEMALWALGMLVVSTLMMLVSALGVWWIRGTLTETRKAVKAADNAVTVTREIGQAQIRAYLSVNSIKAQYIIAQSSKGTTTIDWAFEFKLRNSGQTPARNIWCKVDIITPNAEASGNAAVTFDISGNSEGMFEVRCEVKQDGDAFARGIVDEESFDLRCRVTIGFTDIFDDPCGPFHFLFGATKNFSKHGRHNGLLPIHEAGA